LVARRQQRLRAKALAASRTLREAGRRLDDLLREQAAAARRVESDEKLRALLDCRRAGKPVAVAIREVERRFASSPGKGRYS
jgi:hypothetical protein